MNWKTYCAVLMICFTSLANAYQPGLRIPEWHEGKIDVDQVIEFKQPFAMNFKFQPISVDLKSVVFKLQLPSGVEILEGPVQTSPKDLKSGKRLKQSWLLKVNNASIGMNLGVQVLTSTPKSQLQSQSVKVYSSEPAHQIKQLLEYIEGLDDQTTLSYSKYLMSLPSQSYTTIPALVFKELIDSDELKGPYISYHIKENLDEKTHLQKIEETESFIQQLKKDPEKFSKLLQYNASHYQRLLDDQYYRYYSLAVLKVENKEWKVADEWLQRLTKILLEQEELNYDLFLAIQNLRAFCHIKTDQLSRAQKILSSSIQTATQSTVRHYLMYNLALIYEEIGNKPQAGHYLLEALKLQPGFTLARQMQKRIR